MSQILTAAMMIVIAVGGCAAYFYLGNLMLQLIFPDRGAKAGQNLRRAAQIRPWLFLMPAGVLLMAYLIYPVLRSLHLSLLDAQGEWVGLGNYRWLAGDAKFRESLGNNILWLWIVPALSTALGLILAGLTNRIRWRALAQSLIFMPMAISFVGAVVIWKLIYDYRGPGQGEQIGLLNALAEAFGKDPQAWITLPFWNSLFLMAILIWIQTGFAMVILSAALNAIPQDSIEAACLDGAGPIRIFVQIQLPQIWGMIAVVWTTITVTVLKVFDIVFVMTNGQWGTQVLANLMYDWMFRANDPGRASAIVVVIILLVTPIMLWNIYISWKERR